MSRLLRFCAVAAFLTSASAQAPTLDVLKYLKEISAKAEAARQYAFEGQLELDGQRGTDPGKVLAKAKVKLALGPEGKYLLDLDAVDKDQYLLISDGEKSWAYVPKLKQYTEEETGALDTGDDSEEGGSDTERDLTETFARQVVPILSRIYKTAKEADRAGEAEITVGKKKQKGQVIRVNAKPDGQGGITVTDLVLEPATLNLARLVYTTVTYDKDAKVILRLTVDFTRLQLGESLPDSTFAFAPPKNAKLVESLPIPGQTGSFLLNRTAPEFDLKTLDGQRMRMSDLRGRPVLIDFWASWCGPCRRELPSVARLATEFREKGLVVLGVNDEGKGKARDFAAKNDLKFTTLDDSDSKMSRAFRVHAIPAVYLIDADGKVVRFLRGSHTYDALKASLKAVGL